MEGSSVLELVGGLGGRIGGYGDRRLHKSGGRGSGLIVGLEGRLYKRGSYKGRDGCGWGVGLLHEWLY